jgi:hypothetical protein
MRLPSEENATLQLTLSGILGGDSDVFASFHLGIENMKEVEFTSVLENIEPCTLNQ